MPSLPAWCGRRGLLSPERERELSLGSFSIHDLLPSVVSPNYKIPANSFQPFHFRVSRSND
jgi:hypothetical protein